MITFEECIKDGINIDKELNENIKKLCMMLNYDVVSILNFNNGYKIVTSEKILLRKSNDYINATEKWVKVLADSENYILNILIERKKTLFYCSNSTDNKFLPLIDNIGREIYIPVLKKDRFTNTMDLIACIYISVFDVNKKTTLNDLVKDDIASIISLLTQLCEINYARYQKNESVFSLITMMSEITLATDPLTVLHPYAVAQLSKKIANSLKLDAFATKKLYFSSLLHDVGKMYIDLNILTKKDLLTHDEYTTLKNHSIYGSNIIKATIFYDDISLFVKHHHERYDSKGYPDGLGSNEIPLESRIIGIADACDAMLSPRSYKTPHDIDFVINELIKNSGTQFDPELVDITISILQDPSEDISSLLTNYMMWSTLIIISVLETYSIQGPLIKHGSGYLFKSTKFNFLSAINNNEILDTYIHIHKNYNQFFKFKARLSIYEENQVYISRLNTPLSYDF